MKRLIIVVGILAVATFIAYQFLFADRRSRFDVETAEEADYILNKATIKELNVLAQEASFNESINRVPVRHVSLSSNIPKPGRKLIRNGSMDFEVTDIVAAKQTIGKIVEELGGYLASENEETPLKGPQVYQVVRIPSAQLDAFLSKLTGLAKKIRLKELSSEDVTEEFIDLESRLVTKKELERNYREIMKKATKVEEMLEVERQLELVRGEIESIEGRVNYINSQVSFSTLKLLYFQEIAHVKEKESFSTQLAGSMAKGWSGVLLFIQFLATIWPLLILSAVTVWLYIRYKHKFIQST